MFSNEFIATIKENCNNISHVEVNFCSESVTVEDFGLFFENEETDFNIKSNKLKECSLLYDKHLSGFSYHVATNGNRCLNITKPPPENTTDMLITFFERHGRCIDILRFDDHCVAAVNDVFLSTIALYVPNMHTVFLACTQQKYTTTSIKTLLTHCIQLTTLRLYCCDHTMSCNDLIDLFSTTHHTLTHIDLYGVSGMTTDVVLAILQSTTKRKLLVDDVIDNVNSGDSNNDISDVIESTRLYCGLYLKELRVVGCNKVNHTLVLGVLSLNTHCIVNYVTK